MPRPTEEQVENLLSVLENMIAWTSTQATYNPVFKAVRDEASAVLRDVIDTVDAED